MQITLSDIKEDSKYLKVNGLVHENKIRFSLKTCP